MTCMAGNLKIACDGPAQCGGNPCCLTVKNLLGGPTPQDIVCGMGPTDCAPALDLLAQKLISRRCAMDADCTAGAPMTQLPTCCTGAFGGQSIRFCASAFIAGLAMGKITCQ